MSVSTPFIQRPVATTLLTIAITLGGAIGYTQLPVSPLPQVDFPTVFVTASLPGGSPEVMAASVATPLEKQFTRIAGVTEMTSNSSLGSASVVLQFDLNRDINAAARDVQAVINADAGSLRHGIFGSGAETGAGPGSRAGQRERQFAARRARGTESAAGFAIQRGTRSGGDFPCQRECQPSQGRTDRSRTDIAAADHRSA